VNDLPKVVVQQRRGRSSHPRPLDRKSDALPLSHIVGRDGCRSTVDASRRKLNHKIKCCLHGES